jgi:hypothetical protein
MQKMTDNDCMSLQRQFPRLPFARAADGLLVKAFWRGYSIEQQLLERRIRSVRICENLIYPALIGVKNGDLEISLRDNDEEIELAKSFAWKVGNSYTWTTSTITPKDAFPRERITHELYITIEQFCLAFSEKFLEANGPSDMRRFLQKQRQQLCAVA